MGGGVPLPGRPTRTVPRAREWTPESFFPRGRPSPARLTDRFDAIVVGARLAGAATALRLADGGLRVLLLDRHRMPSPTVSTAAFSHEACLVLDRLGVWKDVLALSPPTIRRVTLDLDGEPIRARVPSHGEFDFYSCVERAALDGVLQERARAHARIDYREGVTLAGLLTEDDRVVGVRAPGADARAPVVLGADGPTSTVARLARARDRARHPVGRWYAYGFFAGETGSRDAAQVVIRGVEQAWRWPADRGRTMVCYAGAHGSYRAAATDLEGSLRARVAALDATLGEGLAPARPEGRLLSAPTYENVWRDAAGAGWALVGDAVMTTDPAFGQGIGHALVTAERYADLLLARADVRAAGEAYAEWHAREYGSLYRFVAHAVSPPRGLPRALARRLARDPVLASLALGVHCRANAPADLARGLGRSLLPGWGARRDAWLDSLWTPHGWSR